jgi:hypothetical protein
MTSTHQHEGERLHKRIRQRGTPVRRGGRRQDRSKAPSGVYRGGRGPPPVTCAGMGAGRPTLRTRAHTREVDPGRCRRRGLGRTQGRLTPAVAAMAHGRGGSSYRSCGRVRQSSTPTATVGARELLLPPRAHAQCSGEFLPPPVLVFFVFDVAIVVYWCFFMRTLSV